MFWRQTGKLRGKVEESRPRAGHIHRALKLGLDPRNNDGVNAVLQAEERESDQRLRRLALTAVWRADWQVLG